MDLEQLRTQYRATSLQLAAQRGAHNLRIFGSVARGTASPDSDVDVLVDLEPGRSLFDLGAFVMDLEGLLNRPVDVVTERGLRTRIRQRVLAEAQTL